MPSPSLSPHDFAVPMPDPLGDLRSEMALWAEPVIADRLADAYAECTPGILMRGALAVHHRRLWRALILGQKVTAERVWLDFQHDLLRAGLDADVVDEIDAVVMEELMDIVFARYRSSREKARGFSRVLLGAAAQTASVRPLHA